MSFRRSGSFVRFLVPPRLVDTSDTQLMRRIARQRFRSIADAVEETESIGWVSPADLTGESIKAIDVLRGEHLFLVLRADRKRAPAAWVRILLSKRIESERAAGVRVSRDRKAELRQEVVLQLLERTLPAVSTAEVVWNVERGHIYLFSTAARMQDALGALFVRTFGADAPVPLTPDALVKRSRLPGSARAAYAEMQPVGIAP